MEANGSESVLTESGTGVPRRPSQERGPDERDTDRDVGRDASTPPVRDKEEFERESPFPKRQKKFPGITFLKNHYGKLAFSIIGITLFLVSAFQFPPVTENATGLAADAALGLGITMLALGTLFILWSIRLYFRERRIFLEDQKASAESLLADMVRDASPSPLLDPSPAPELNPQPSKFRIFWNMVSPALSALVGGTLILLAILKFPPFAENGTALAADLAGSFGVSMFTFGLLFLLVPVGLYLQEVQIKRKKDDHAHAGEEHNLTLRQLLTHPYVKWSLLGLLYLGVSVGLIVSSALLLTSPNGPEIVKLTAEGTLGLSIAGLALGSLLMLIPAAFYLRAVYISRKEDAAGDVAHDPLVPREPSRLKKAFFACSAFFKQPVVKWPLSVVLAAAAFIIPSAFLLSSSTPEDVNLTVQAAQGLGITGVVIGGLIILLPICAGLFMRYHMRSRHADLSLPKPPSEVDPAFERGKIWGGKHRTKISVGMLVLGTALVVLSVFFFPQLVDKFFNISQEVAKNASISLLSIGGTFMFGSTIALLYFKLGHKKRISVGVLTLGSALVGLSVFFFPQLVDNFFNISQEAAQNITISLLSVGGAFVLGSLAMLIYFKCRAKRAVGPIAAEGIAAVEQSLAAKERAADTSLTSPSPSAPLVESKSSDPATTVLPTETGGAPQTPFDRLVLMQKQEEAKLEESLREEEKQLAAKLQSKQEKYEREVADWYQRAKKNLLRAQTVQSSVDKTFQEQTQSTSRLQSLNEDKFGTPSSDGSHRKEETKTSAPSKDPMQQEHEKQMAELERQHEEKKRVDITEKVAAKREKYAKKSSTRSTLLLSEKRQEHQEQQLLMQVDMTTYEATRKLFQEQAERANQLRQIGGYDPGTLQSPLMSTIAPPNEHTYFHGATAAPADEPSLAVRSPGGSTKKSTGFCAGMFSSCFGKKPPKLTETELVSQPSRRNGTFFVEPPAVPPTRHPTGHSSSSSSYTGTSSHELTHSSSSPTTTFITPDPTVTFHK